VRVEVQVFGTQKHQETRRALRFWSERRVKVHFVDLNERAASRGELRRFVQKFGVRPLSGKSSRRYADLRLGAARLGGESWLQNLIEDRLLLTQPLTRFGSKLAVGPAESEWKSWVTAERGS